MTHRCHWLRILILCCLAVSISAEDLPTQAEVSVITPGPSGYGNSGLYVGVIVDDPSPSGIVWLSHVQGTSNRAVLNGDGAQRGDGPPTTVGNPSGLCIVAWAMNTPTGYDVVFSRFNDGAWSTPAALASSSVDELDPFLIQGPDGAIHLFYWESGAVPRVLYRRAPPDLSSWTPPLPVSESEIAACRPAAVFHQGVLYVTYEAHDYGYGQTPRQVVVARQDGEAFVQEVLAITQNAEPVWPQIHSRSGRIWADWIDAPGRMFWTRRDEETGWTPVQLEAYEGVLQRDFFVRGTIRHLAGQ